MKNKVNITAEQSGDFLLIKVSGDTKPHREFIKAQGVKIWNNEEKLWWTKYGTSANYEALIAYFGGEGTDEPNESIQEPKKTDKPQIDASVKLTEQWQKVADSCQKKSDDLNTNLARKETNTHKRMREYQSARNTQVQWQDVADAAQALANGFRANDIPSGVKNLVSKLKISVGKDPYENSLYPFCKYRYYSQYGDSSKFQWNYENRKPNDFTVEDCVMVRDYLIQKSGKAPEDPRKKEIEKLISEVKFGKIEGFFPTPQKVIDQMIDLADIGVNHSILEPSAGIGSIADAIKAIYPNNTILCIEQNYTLAKILDLKGYDTQRSDFMDFKGKQFDRILMNPPFENGQDGLHIQHAFTLLAPGGKLVAIAGEGIFSRGDKKAVAFREWLEDKGYSDKLPSDSFNGKDSFRKTGVATRIVVIDKPEEVNSVEKQDSTQLNLAKITEGVNGFNSEAKGMARQHLLYDYMVGIYEELVAGLSTKDFKFKEFLNDGGVQGLELLIKQAGVKKELIDVFMHMMISEIKSRLGYYEYAYFEAKYYLQKLEI